MYAIFETLTVKKERKGRVFIYRLFAPRYTTKHSGMDHTVLPSNNTMPALNGFQQLK